MWHQYVEVNGVMIPTTEFVKNRERLMQANNKKDKETPVVVVKKNEISDVSDSELNKVPVEEKTLQNDAISDEKSEEIIKEEIETIIIPERGELIKEHKKVFGKFPAPKLTNQEIYLKIQKAKELD